MSHKDLKCSLCHQTFQLSSAADTKVSSLCSKCNYQIVSPEISTTNSPRNDTQTKFSIDGRIQDVETVKSNSHGNLNAENFMDSKSNSEQRQKLQDEKSPNQNRTKLDF